MIGPIKSSDTKGRCDLEDLNFAAVTDQASFSKFLADVDAQLERSTYEKTEIDWAKKWKEPFDSEREDQIEKVYDEIFTEANHEPIREWKDRVDDPLLQRWAEALDWRFKLERVDRDDPDLARIKRHISDRYVMWRPSIDGEEIGYRNQSLILRHEQDRSLREKAWLSLWELNNDIEDATREMFQRRKEAVAKWGFETLGDMQLVADGVDRKWLMDFVESMEEATREQYSAHLSERAAEHGIDRIMPWDVRFFFETAWPDKKYFPGESLNDSVDEFARALGLNPAEMGIELYPYDSPYGGQCVRYAPGDIRILTGYADGMQYYKTAYHEYGHALHAWYSESPFSLRAETGPFNEGVAEVLAMYLHYPSWLERLGLPDAEIERYRRTRRELLIYRDRSICADAVAELRVWDDVDGDYQKIYGDTAAWLMGNDPIPQPFSAVPRWIHPMRMHSYFIADAVSSQTHAALRRDHGEVFDNPEPFRTVIDQYLRPGGSVQWLDKIEGLTGEPLKFDYLGEQLTRDFPKV